MVRAADGSGRCEPSVTDKPWAGRFTQPTDAAAERFTASLSFDRRLWPYDVAGSLAWARALHRAGLLSDDECQVIVKGLETVRDELACEQGLRVMESWLGGEGPDTPLPVRPEHLEKLGGMARLLGLLAAALQVETRAARAELALVDILGGPGRGSFLARLRSSALVPSIELLVALIDGDARRILVALRLVVAPLPACAR